MIVNIGPASHTLCQAPWSDFVYQKVTSQERILIILDVRQKIEKIIPPCLWSYACMCISVCRDQTSLLVLRLLSTYF